MPSSIAAERGQILTDTSRDIARAPWPSSLDDVPEISACPYRSLRASATLTPSVRAHEQHVPVLSQPRDADTGPRYGRQRAPAARLARRTRRWPAEPSAVPSVGTWLRFVLRLRGGGTVRLP